MSKFLAKDIRKIINQLDEYILSDVSEDKKEENTKDDLTDANTAKDTTDEKPIDDVLTEPAGLKKIVGNLNVQSLINLLDLPGKHQSNFRSAINALKVDNPVLTNAQAMAFAVAFTHLLSIHDDKIDNLDLALKKVHGVDEELDAGKIQSYMNRDKSSTPSNTVDQMKNMIAAVNKHGTPDEKKELGIG